jgi:SAM-dependent methyltransferase
MNEDLLIKDKHETINNRKKLILNKNILYWYENLFKHQFIYEKNPESKLILEIGSGTSPLKDFFLKNVITSDILELDYLDYIFDCHFIHQVNDIQNESLDIITASNVLHHLRDPITFLIKASQKLKKGGKIIITEPYFSFISYIIYEYLHHEPTDFKISSPILTNITGPLSTANIALPYLIFFKKNWYETLSGKYDIIFKNIRYFTSLSYFLTGGISSKIPVPKYLYRIFFKIDVFLASLFPKLFASFFTIELINK